MMNAFENGWLAEQEGLDKLFASSQDGLEIVSESEAVAIIEEAAKNPVKAHPWDMAQRLYDQGECPYNRLKTWNQDANNCAAHGTEKAVSAFMLLSAWMGTRYELTPFQNFVPWIYGVGKNESGNTGDNGATMTSMLSLITQHGVLPDDTPNIPDYSGTSKKWCQRYGKLGTARNAPYNPFVEEAKKYVIKAAQIPKDPDVFYKSCKGGFAIAFGTRQKIRMTGTGKNRKWILDKWWMHAMAAYCYDPTTDMIGIDNSHGDGFAWADRKVINAVVNASYFDGFVILGMTPRKGRADWNPIGRS